MGFSRSMKALLANGPGPVIVKRPQIEIAQRRVQNHDQRVILAFTTGCSYRRRLEAWLGRSSIVAERIMEYGSYHAIAACVAAMSVALK